MDYGVVACLAAYLLAYTMTIGSVFFVHAAETTVNAINGLALQSLFMWILVLSILSPIMINETGIGGTFGFYAATTFLGFIYQIIFVKESSYRWDEKLEQFVKLTEKDKKLLYAPAEFRDDKDNEDDVIDA